MLQGYVEKAVDLPCVIPLLSSCCSVRQERTQVLQAESAASVTCNLATGESPRAGSLPACVGGLPKTPRASPLPRLSIGAAFRFRDSGPRWEKFGLYSAERKKA